MSTGRRVLLGLFLAMTIIPTLELFLLLRISESLGPALTVLLVLVTGAIGASLAKREGFSVLRTIQEESKAGFPAGDRVVEGVMVLVGGLLLVTPGVMTDAFGLTLIAPPSRRALAPRLKAAILSKVKVQVPDETPKSYDPKARSRERKAEVQAESDTPFNHPTL